MRDIEIKENILFQIDMCWQLYLYHTENLKETEALWTFSPMGLQIRRQDDGWSIDWPEIESYEIGPSSIAWIMWHIIYWWRTTLDSLCDKDKVASTCLSEIVYSLLFRYLSLILILLIKIILVYINSCQRKKVFILFNNGAASQYRLH